MNTRTSRDSTYDFSKKCLIITTYQGPGIPGCEIIYDCDDWLWTNGAVTCPALLRTQSENCLGLISRQETVRRNK